METDNTTVETVEDVEVSQDVESNQPSDFQAPQSQSELDSIVNKAVQTALKNQKKSEETRINEAIAKALQKEQDYSKLSAAERASKEFEDQKAEFEKQVAEFELEKLNMAVKQDLVSKGLPVELADMFSHAENASEALKLVGTFEKVFNDAVAEKVKATIRQNAPKAASAGGTQTDNFGAQLAKSTNVTTARFI
ncbi:head scaffolding protein [Streptococcus phage P7952]|uniref:Scaffolding protein n=2 Tax=Brussowvirus TaxID=1623303 RepID=A0A286QSP2_9CAUD|nr:head scaffolding protein [Streptococcus phage P7952]YP_010683218.1 head scaffolding protein [Streptococcus phage P7955]ARU14238.1 scaffolding protein [Streptococcus phage P7952]ARU14374.1 scaffolding protein [Streptococcus phage P7955]